MSPHRLVIAAGPARIHRLCCGADKDSDIAATALDAIDDPVALVDERPISVDALWSAALRSLVSGHSSGVIVVHPSWWSASRVGVVSVAAQRAAGVADAGEVAVQPRSWLLTRAACENRAVVVEIAEQLVVITADEMLAVPRRTEAHPLAAEVAGVIETMTQGAAVIIDAPGAITGAPVLATLIADAVRTRRRTVVAIDDARLSRLAASIADEPCRPRRSPAASRFRVRTVVRGAAAGVVLTVVGLAVAAMTSVEPAEPPGAPATQTAPTTVLVEGRVAVTIPAGWLTQRVIAGPGSARVQVTSPLDPEVALHVTQSPTPGETLAAAADRLRQAVDTAPAGVFVDFNPAAVSAGRPAVTYREVRAAHDVRWTVLLDGSVRISIGCQSRPAARDAVRDACEQAVRSAHALE
jgi:type VII secretion-associated protein (TIGR03931 family)